MQGLGLDWWDGEMENGKRKILIIARSVITLMTEGSPIRSMHEYQPTALSVLTGESLPNHRSVQPKACLGSSESAP